MEEHDLNISTSRAPAERLTVQFFLSSFLHMTIMTERPPARSCRSNKDFGIGRFGSLDSGIVRALTFVDDHHKVVLLLVEAVVFSLRILAGIERRMRRPGRFGGRAAG